MNLETKKLPSVLSTYDQVSAAVRHVFDSTVALDMPQTYFDSAMEHDFAKRLNKAMPNSAELAAFGTGMANAYLDCIQRHHCEFVYITPDSSIHKGGTTPMVQATGVYSAKVGSLLPSVTHYMTLEDRAACVGGLIWKVRSRSTVYLPFGAFMTDEERIRLASGV